MEEVRTEFRMDQLAQDYPELVDSVVKHGSLVWGRTEWTREVIGLLLRLQEPEHCLVGRDNFSAEFMDMEILQLLAGEYDGDLLRDRVLRAGELITAYTAYGPRIVDQMPHVIAELVENGESRRAEVLIARPGDLEAVRDPSRTGDTAGEMPCTVSWSFYLRDNCLDMVVYMRSWDLVWGLSYDVPSFVAYQMAIAQHLGAAIGEYIHLAGSGHVYEKHWHSERWPNDASELEVPYIADDIEDTWAAARDLLQMEREELRARRG